MESRGHWMRRVSLRGKAPVAHHVCKVVLACSDTISDAVNGLGLIMEGIGIKDRDTVKVQESEGYSANETNIYEQERLKDTGKGSSTVLLYGVAILCIMLFPGVAYGLSKEVGAWKKTKSVMVWMFLFPFVLVVSGVGSLFPVWGPEQTKLIRKDFSNMKTYESVLEGGLQTLLNFYLILNYPDRCMSWVHIITLSLSILSLYVGCYEIWVARAKGEILFLGKVLIFFTLPNNLVIILSFYFYIIVHEYLNGNSMCIITGFSIFFPIGFVLSLLHLAYLIRIISAGTLINLTSAREQDTCKKKIKYSWIFISNIMVDVEGTFIKLIFVIIKIMPTMILSMVILMELLNAHADFIMDHGVYQLLMLDEVVLGGCLSIQLTLTTLNIIYLCRPSFFIGKDSVNDCDDEIPGQLKR